ncbi:MAG TPA: MATE family efflux transporter [Solirubrobacteraceae bacterium]|nr:MATE family efflux transporter [Solirubrobacteraceae bacterium]
MSRWRSPYDRQILSLAVPALGALAAGPLYSLADTAIVGHLGPKQLAALALAGTVLAVVVELGDFLSYGTTGQVARLHAAGAELEAGAISSQALWLAVGAGVIAVGVLLIGGGPFLSLIGRGAGVHGRAHEYLDIAAWGVPAQLVALAGEGCMRGVGDLRTPLRILVVANAANVVLEVGLVYGAHLGLVGSAVGTLVAQLGMGVAFARRMLAAPARSRRPSARLIRPLLRTGSHLTVRTAALLGAFTLASALAARFGAAALGAHQVAFQLFLFLALVLDAIAIAGQILVARLLGSGDVDGAWRAAVRMLWWSIAWGAGFGLVLALASGVGPHAFTSNPGVLGDSRRIWLLLGLMQPLAGGVFALDGILIGAGDTRFLAWAMAVAIAVFVPLALTAGDVAGLWWALNALIAARLVTLLPRFVRRRWAIVGARAA